MTQAPAWIVGVGGVGVRRRYLAERLARHAGLIRTRQVHEIRIVERIKEFASKFEMHSFGYIDAFDETEVKASESRTRDINVLRCAFSASDLDAGCAAGGAHRPGEDEGSRPGRPRLTQSGACRLYPFAERLVYRGW